MSDQTIASYSFLPWLRQGIAANIITVDKPGISGPKERANVELDVILNNQELKNTIQLIGPGDIIGINSRAIVRTEPRNWITDFETNYLPFIEFCDEDFLWRYTPARANEEHRLRPWLFLIVLKEEEFERNKQVNEPLPSSIKIKASTNPGDVLPDPTQIWAWAHVHVDQDVYDKNINKAIQNLEKLLKQNPDLAASRLVCPRKLELKTAYYAFLVPAFETGRLAGLGEKTDAIDSLLPAWKLSSDNRKREYEFPVYYEWYFRTSVKGDFEYLVNLLQPRTMDPKVGIRDMDVQNPGFNVTGIKKPPTLGLEGALKSPETKSTDWPPTPPPKFQQDLEKTINLPDDLQKASGTTKEPIVTPPLYGKWHAIVKRLDISSDNWINDLNKDPRTRTAAGLGTLVVQKNQEEYMESAWKQIGDVLEANQCLKLAQMAREASYQLFIKDLSSLAVEQVVSTTAPVHKMVLGSSATIYQLTKDSNLPLAALSPAFRKIIRPRGAIMKKVAPEDAGKPNDILKQLNEGVITAAPPKQAPEKNISLNDVADDMVPSWVPKWLKKLLKYSLWIFIGIILILLSLMLLIGNVAILSILIAVTIALFGLAQRLKRRIDAASQVSEENLTTDAVNRIPPNPGFSITLPGEDLPADSTNRTGPDSPEGAKFREALLDLHRRFETKFPEPAPKAPLDFNVAHAKLLQTIDPAYAIPKRILSFINIPEIKFVQALDPIHPVMAHPDFPQPMYKPLRDISTELLIPNLNLIKQNTISLLETNQKFIESYMVGLNHEMGRELLWREYPTDQRGSYFRQFWDVSSYVNRDKKLTPKKLAEKLRDIKPIHTWLKSTKLGKHNNRDAEGDVTQLVLVIRGDLLKRYPDAVIFAQKAKWQKDKNGKIDKFKPRRLDKSNEAKNKKFPLYGAEVDPDIHFLGFDLTVEEARGKTDDDPGWFFVIQERPGEPRFGLDAADQAVQGNVKKWNDLSWGHLGDPKKIKFIDVNKKIIATDETIKWGSNSADMAYILYQVPMMVAVHAEEMLKSF